ncbi:COP9 signalosome catalytic subunit rri1 [Tulasnella sp. 417]|nr:COP9 signalosome catalytic subunit rri1 [Tulasnella sp. 417]
MDSKIAFQTFSLENDIKEVDPKDKLFDFDEAEQRRVVKEEPWKKEYVYRLKIASIDVIHARSGGIYEIMGLMAGKVDGDSIVITDSFALPVQGTETRVNAQNEANEYMVQYIEATRQSGHKESIIGWYHSHPGYGCWLSGIDVNTQDTNQKYQDPFVAVVVRSTRWHPFSRGANAGFTIALKIDPNRTISAGKVDIGAFRTYPEGYKPPNSSTEYQSIPLNKIEDFGVHANQYYPLDVQIFKSKLDDDLLGLLWNKYWVNTLSSSPLISNRAYAVSQLNDLAAKLTKGQQTAQQRRGNPEGLVLPTGAELARLTAANKASDKDAMIMSPPANKTGAAKGKEKDASAGGTVSLVPPKPVEDSALMKAVKDRSPPRPNTA